MIININDNIQIEYTNHPLENMDNSNAALRSMLSRDYIIIQNRKFPIINPSELIRSRSKDDGYYRVIYIQINMATGEYYIGKANRPTYNQLKKYQGSGLKFKRKFDAHKDEFVRYYIAICKTAKETEELESSIVNDALLLDEKCLNLVCGGGGTTEHPSPAERAKKQRQYMLDHPEQYKKMLTVSEKFFRSGDSVELRLRSEKIRNTMSAEKYKDMTKERIKKWQEAHPEEYLKSRNKLKQVINSIEVKNKKSVNIKKWREQNPEKVKVWEQNRLKALQSQECKDKQRASLIKWKKEHPEEDAVNTKKRSLASVQKTSKSVCMINLSNGDVVKTFKSLADAGRYLKEESITNSVNPQSVISSVCLAKTVKGHGQRKIAYGFGWCFEDDIKKNNNRYKKQ